MDPNDSNASPSSDSTQQELYGDALNTALTQETTLEAQVADIRGKIDQLGDQPTDVDGITGGPGPKATDWLNQYKVLDGQLKSASTNLSAAKRNTANLYLKIAGDATNRARIQGQSQVWAAQAQDAQAAARVKSTQADLLDAYGAQKDAATIQKLQAAATDATAQAQLRSQQTQTSATQATLNSARAVQINELTPELVKMDAARTGLYAANAALSTQRMGLVAAQTAKTNAQTEYLLPAQVDELVQRGLLDQAKADQIKSLGPAKLDDLVAKGLLDRTKVAQIQAQISKWSVLPATDSRSPTLVEQQPSTGDIRGVPNPGYVNQTLQGISDTNQAIQQVQSQIANGQMTPEDGTALINNLRQALQYKSLGVTPDQYVQMQDQQAQMGRGLLNDYMGTLGRGQDTANTFLSYASRARGLPAGVNFTPFSTFGQIAQNVYGPSLQKAQDLINQVQPVSDRFTALQALSNLSAAKSHLEAASTANPTVGTNQANPMDTTANPTVGASNPTVGMQDFTSPSYARTGPGQ